MAKKTITITEGRKELFRIAEEVQKPDTQFVFTVEGKPGVVLMSVDEYDSLMETMEILSNPEIIRDIRQAEKDYREGKYSSWEEVKKELALMKEPAPALRDKSRKKYGKK
ncbi:MAG: type II toxin-antitoxin system Phd/YefM family antitoxin [Patescibacteria group bacterium]